MSKLIQSIIDNATVLHRTIVLCEGEDSRIAQAARIVTDMKLANIVLLGNVDKIKEASPNVSLEGINVIDPATSPKLEEYANFLYELRKAKGLSLDDARKLTANSLYYGAIMTKLGEADGMVAGAINSTGNVLRPALQIIKTKKGVKTVSSCFIMCFDDTLYKDNNVLIFGDCAVNPDPNSDQLADIAISTANTAEVLAGLEPKVAMLSFSTKGSAKHENVDKVVAAFNKVRELCPDLLIDGELQVDSALVPEIGQLKAPDSKIAGHANVLIFPDLQSGNIGYKLVQRLAGAEAIGPVCQGFDKPVNDLSRGCSVDDVVSVVAITALQSK